MDGTIFTLIHVHFRFKFLALQYGLPAESVNPNFLVRFNGIDHGPMCAKVSFGALLWIRQCAPSINEDQSILFGSQGHEAIRMIHEEHVLFDQVQFHCSGIA